MSQSQAITPQKINKPIQLLAAWLAGLILINGSFLSTAVLIEKPVWAAGLLIIASAINVPVFIFSLFLLQTKFRPEMQEDSFYHEYLINKLGAPKETSQSEFPATPKNEVWEKYKVLINHHFIKDQKLISALSNHGIQVTGAFGAENPPQDKVATVGENFTLEQLKQILPVLKEANFNWVNFGADEEEDDQYDNTILIGSYVPSPNKESITISAAMDVVFKKDAVASDFYRAIHTAYMH